MAFSKEKSGLPFIIFLVVATTLFSLWFLKSQNDFLKQINTGSNNPVNLNSNQASVVSTNESGKVVEEKETKKRTFQNSNYHFAVVLSGNESVKEASSEGIYTMQLGHDKISVMDEGKEGSVRGSVTTVSEEKIMMAGITGTKIIGTSPKDGSEINLILVKNSGRLYYFQGSVDFLERMTNDFSFTN